MNRLKVRITAKPRRLSVDEKCSTHPGRAQRREILQRTDRAVDVDRRIRFRVPGVDPRDLEPSIAPGSPARPRSCRAVRRVPQTSALARAGLRYSRANASALPKSSPSVLHCGDRAPLVGFTRSGTAPFPLTPPARPGNSFSSQIPSDSAAVDMPKTDRRSKQYVASHVQISLQSTDGRSPR